MEKNLFRYVWHHTKRDQVWILFIVLLSMPTYFIALVVPKYIINGPVQGTGFEGADATSTFLRITFDVPGWISDVGEIVIFSGLELDRIDTLVVLSSIFLLLVCINGYFKFYINLFKGKIGERTLRRLRFELIDRVMRFPSAHFQRIKAPEVASMVKDEVEPLGQFIGDTFVQPVFLGGQAATAMFFILTQNIWLGSIAAFIVIVQAILIPWLRRPLVGLAKIRQLHTRAFAGRIGEIVDGISEIHINDTSNFEKAEISTRLGDIYYIRFALYKKRFFLKFVNEFLSQITPFLFYLIGGYFAVTGRLDIGQLVAVIAAYKELPTPIGDLIRWDQSRLNVQIKYTSVIEQFATDNMIDPAAQKLTKGPVETISGDISVTNLSAIDDTGSKIIERASFQVPVTQTVAVVGELNSGAEAICDVLAGIQAPATGRVKLGSKYLHDLPESVKGRRIGYIGPRTYFAQASIKDSLLYSLKHASEPPQTYKVFGDHATSLVVEEIQASGTTELVADTDWIDYEGAGIAKPEDLARRILETTRFASISNDIYDLGLRGTLDAASQSECANKILEARRVLREQLTQLPLSKLVEPLDPEKYNTQQTIAENLLFGTSVGDAFATTKLATNRYLLEILESTGLRESLFDIGVKIAETVVELFADLPPGHPFFEQLSFMDAEELPEYSTALARVGTLKADQVSSKDFALFLKLPFSYVEPRHRLKLLDEDIKNRILAVRSKFRNNLPQELAGSIEFYNPETYNSASSIEANILFGRIAYGVAEASLVVKNAIQKVVDQLNLHNEIFDVGLNYNVGTGGKRLSMVQQQKLALARVLLKQPDILIGNNPFTSLDKQSRKASVERLLDLARGKVDNQKPFGLFLYVSEPELAMKFDRVLAFEDGVLVEQGTPDELKKKKGLFTRLLARN